jgi:prepilin-type N-terminal cleavage/methylation domain-containing protein
MIHQKGSNEKGFSLIEAMMGMAVLSILALGMASLMTRQSRDQKTVQAKVAYNNLVNAMQAAVTNPKTVLDSSKAQIPSNVMNAYDLAATTRA